jgi:hypothetical protein
MAKRRKPNTPGPVKVEGSGKDKSYTIGEDRKGGSDYIGNKLIPPNPRRIKTGGRDVLPKIKNRRKKKAMIEKLHEGFRNHIAEHGQKPDFIVMHFRMWEKAVLHNLGAENTTVLADAVKSEFAGVPVFKTLDCGEHTVHFCSPKNPNL